VHLLNVKVIFFWGGKRGHSHGSACEGLEVGLCNGREKESGKNSIKTQYEHNKCTKGLHMSGNDDMNVLVMTNKLSITYTLNSGF